MTHTSCCNPTTKSSLSLRHKLMNRYKVSALAGWLAGWFLFSQRHVQMFGPFVIQDEARRVPDFFTSISLHLTSPRLTSLHPIRIRAGIHTGHKCIHPFRTHSKAVAPVPVFHCRLSVYLSLYLPFPIYLLRVPPVSVFHCIYLFLSLFTYRYLYLLSFILP